MSLETAKQRGLKIVLDLLQVKSGPILGELEKKFAAQRILVETEKMWLSRKGDKYLSKRIDQFAGRQKHYEMVAGHFKVLDQIAKIKVASPSKDGILVDGRVTDDQLMGITKFARKNIYVSLYDKDSKPIPGIPAKRCKPDASGYFSIRLTEEDSKTLIEKKIEPKILVEDSKGKVMKEFTTPILPKVSKIPLGSRVTTSISFAPAEIVRQKAKRAEEAKLRAAEVLEREVMRERELEEERKREEAERLKLVEETREKLMEEIAKERKAEKTRFERETRERLEAEMEEKMKAKKLEIEEETRKKIEAERKKEIPKLDEISGIGSKRAEKLMKKGIADIEDFYKTPADKLGKILGISESRVQVMKKDNISLLTKALSKREKGVK